MASSLKELLAQREALEAKITELRAAELSDAVSKVRAIIDEYGLTPDDVFTRTSSAKTRKTSTATKVAAKYRDPISGKTWSGRGLQPKFLAGKNKEDFLIA